MHELQQLYFAMSHGVLVNKNGEYYQEDKSYGVDVKLFIVAKYLDHKERLDGMWPSMSKVALGCRVSKKIVVKFEHELMENSRILAPEEILMARSLPIGLGSQSMADEDIFILYLLYWQDPTRSLKSYVYWLFCCTGLIVSSSAVLRWFNHAFPVRGRLCVPNLIPYDKFRLCNMEKAWKYPNHNSKISPEQLKYGYEKSLKGKAIFNKLAWRDVLTRLVPHTMTDPDLRNTYSIIGTCGICTGPTPVRYQITDATVDPDLFLIEIEAAIAKRFLRAGDVLVLDNAANHTGKGNTMLENWLWEEHSVLALFLPARAPEWNSIIRSSSMSLTTLILCQIGLKYMI